MLKLQTYQVQVGNCRLDRSQDSSFSVLARKQDMCPAYTTDLQPACIHIMVVRRTTRVRKCSKWFQWKMIVPGIEEGLDCLQEKDDLIDTCIFNVNEHTMPKS